MRDSRMRRPVLANFSLGAGVYTRVAAYVPWIESVVWPLRPDGCVNNVPFKHTFRKSYSYSADTYLPVYEESDVQVPNTGPGTVARGMCWVFNNKFCYNADARDVKPELTSDDVCHHNFADGPENSGHEVVMLMYGDSSYNRRHSCAGALVSPNTILTAARCATLGCLPLSKVEMYGYWWRGCSSGSGLADVEKVTVHPEYRPGRAYADLAVVKLTASYDLREFLPVCLNTVADVPVRAGLRATAAGWNIVGTWEDLHLHKPNNTLTVRSPERCSAALLEHDRLRSAMPEGYQPSLLCAGGLCDNDTYAGDPGTPLISFKHTLLSRHGPFAVDYVLGIASSLSYCTVRDADGHLLPDLFADVSQHIDWIERTVWPDEAD